MTDIVGRLRVHAWRSDGWTRQDAAEAADEIERLRMERDKYMAAYDAAVDEHLHDQMRLRDAGDENDRLRGVLEEIESPPFEVMGHGSWEACEWMIERAANALGKDRT